MNKISDLRKNTDELSQRELAKKLGVTQASISRWENNQLSISGRNLIKVATFFKVSVDSLLGIGSE